MATLKNHPNRWLRDDAAAEFDRAEADHGAFTVNSAGRTKAEQNGLIARWDRGGRANRPPFLFAPARPAEESNHVSNGGIAVDLADWRRFAKVCEDYGFEHPDPESDPVHFEFRGGRGGNRTKRSTKAVQKLVGATPDGVYGPDTRAKVKAWQKAHGLTADGIWGPRSDAKGFPPASAPAPAPASGRPTIRRGSKDANVRALQQKLKSNYELYAGRLSVDGIFGPATEAAVREFQRRAGLTVDGIVGPKTWARIGL